MSIINTNYNIIVLQPPKGKKGKKGKKLPGK